MSDPIPALAAPPAPDPSPPRTGGDPPPGVFAGVLGAVQPDHAPPPQDSGETARTAQAEGQEAGDDTSGDTQKPATAADAAPATPAQPSHAPHRGGRTKGATAPAAADRAQAPTTAVAQAASPAVPADAAAAAAADPAQAAGAGLSAPAQPAQADAAVQTGAPVPAPAQPQIQAAAPAAAAPVAPAPEATLTAPAPTTSTADLAGGSVPAAAPAAAATAPAAAATAAPAGPTGAAAPATTTAQAAVAPATADAQPRTTRGGERRPAGRTADRVAATAGQGARHASAPAAASSSATPATAQTAAPAAGASQSHDQAATGSALAGDRTTAGPQPKAADAEPLRARMQDVIDAARATIRVASRNGTATARISLHPEELGGVRVTMRVHDGEVAATLTAETAAGARALTADGDSLRRNLESQGFVVTKLDVQVAGDGTQSREDQNQPSAQADGTPGRISLGDADEETEETTIEPSRLPLSGSRVDVLA